MVTATRENIMDMPLKAKKSATLWFCRASPKIIGRQVQNSKKHMHPSVHGSTVCNTQDEETYKMSTDRRTDKIEVIHVHNGIQFFHAKAWNNANCRIIDKPKDNHTKWTKRDSERQILYDLTYTWDLYIYIIEIIEKHKQSHKLKKNTNLWLPNATDGVKGYIRTMGFKIQNISY